MGNQPDVILFDLMDTLVYDPFNREIPEFFGLTKDELLAEKTAGNWVSFELRERTESEFLNRFFADGRSFDHDEFRRTVREAYRWKNGMEPLLNRLRNQPVRLEAASNYPVWYRMIDDKLHLGNHLGLNYISCEMGVRKPAEEFFAYILDDLDGKPGDMLFVDDRPDNCQGASRLGIRTHRFTGVTGLLDRLSEMDLLKPAGANPQVSEATSPADD